MIFTNFPITCLITEGKFTSENFDAEQRKLSELVNISIENKISFIQIREKKLPAKLVLTLTQEIVKIAENSETKILVNDRFDIALAAGADGVHLTSTSLPTNIVRKNVPAEFIIGVSTHSLEKARQNKNEGADFVTFSPVFKTASKEKYGKPQGLEKLWEVCKKLNQFPVIALGGINEENYRTVLENGAKGFASIGFLNNADNLRKLKL